MSTTDETIENLDADSSPRQPGPVAGQAENGLLGLDGALPSIRSVSLILQALIPLLISLVLLLAGRRLYRFTTTVSVGFSCALFTWALFVNLEEGQSIGGWTGEVAALTVWSVMVGGGLIGAIIGYQSTWWGAHVTGRLCLGANSGVGFAFSVLLFKAGLLIHSPAGQWSLVSVCAIIGVLLVLCDHVIGPLFAISLCGSFLFLLGVDLFNTLGDGGVASGLRLLLDHNPDHQMIITPYNPSKSTAILIIVSWVIAVLSFGFQYAFYHTPFGPLPPIEERDEEERLGSEGKSKGSFSQGSSEDAKKEISGSEVNPQPTEHYQTINIRNPRTSTGASIGTKASATLVECNRVAGAHESSNLPYASPRAGPVVVGEYGSPPALALSPTVYSRYRRTLDAEHKPPGRSPIQYNIHSNLNPFNNPRRVETVDEVTETSTSVRGGDLTARSSMLTVGGAPEKKARSNSVSEEYLQAMMRLATGEVPENKAKDIEQKQLTPGTRSMPVSAQEDRSPKIAPVQDTPSPKLSPITESETQVAVGHSSAKVGQSENSPVLVPAPEQATSSLVPISAPMSSSFATHESQLSPVHGQTEIPPAEGVKSPISADARDQPNIGPNKTSQPLSKWPSCSSFGQVLSTGSRGSGNPETEDRHSAAPRTAARARCPGISLAEPDSNSRRSRELGLESRVGSVHSGSHQARNGQSTSGEELAGTESGSSELASSAMKRLLAGTSESGSSELAASAMKRFSHRPLPLPPRGVERGDAPGTLAVSSPSPSSNHLRDTGSLNSATSQASSALDSFARADRDSSVPTTPSWSGNILKDDRKEEVAYSSGASSRKKLSIIVTKSPVQVERGSLNSPSSQEAERDHYSDVSNPGANSAVPHTPTMGNMLLRVAENTEKLRRQVENSNKESANNRQAVSSQTSREDDGDGETVRSEASKRSTVCMSSAYGHTSADEGGRSSSESEYGDDDEQSREYFNPSRFQQLDQAMGEWGQVVGQEARAGGRLEDGGSPSLQSIPLPSRESHTGPSSYTTESSSRTAMMGGTPFVGQPLAEVPWPQRRPNQPGEPNTPAANEKRWTSASSIFPPLAYESSAESPRPERASDERANGGHSSSDSGTDRIPLRRLRETTNGSVASFEEDSRAARHGMFCSASSHVDDDYHDLSSVSHVDETDAEDPYESAADYSRSLRASLNGGYLTADD
ncbi:hypothetical protein PTTG_08728 [Puccinia triticina 1-1 BBBD Race 1]|uniref:DUF4203 domain-containing protein n=1 Tax=Puccinia triticina (isolate 1-1 / race 1 (BBBD)) TaxID=630390 RepID=A0A180GLA6_PUCT1|nr:hypothetical protein PTTG_08728 [Puccinia triticina 1-1 BBBD Race 1]WAR60798.1 hypothetical protein PtB15_13B43 [Puccinia triticina]